MAAHVTPGTLISAYEVYEALRRGIAVAFRKSDAERVRTFCEMKTLDRGGLILQPVPGLYEGIAALDFTSLYPSLIVKHNLSPEGLGGLAERGFLPDVLEPLLKLRCETKRLKGGDPAVAGLDAVLKWMLVTCFGYTGYKNAKFGRIEVHEQITRHARETLLLAKSCAEDLGLRVVHGIVDCLWVQGDGVGQFADAVQEATGLSAELEVYDWIVFLPMDDGFGAYNRYYGRLSSGKIKYRGVMVRRGDTPEYIKRMQMALFEVLESARNAEGLCSCAEQAASCYRVHRDGLPGAAPEDLAIFHRIGRLEYGRRCAGGSAIAAYRAAGIDLTPGMEIGYVVRDAARWLVDPVWDAERFDRRYYEGLLAKAWTEVEYALRCAGGREGRASRRISNQKGDVPG
jgi:DNA polymerase I